MKSLVHHYVSRELIQKKDFQSADAIVRLEIGK